MTWGLVPEHHNYWLDRADYEAGTAWEEAHADATAELIAAVADEAQLIITKISETL